MNWLTLDQREKIRAFAVQEPDKETCGFVMQDNSVLWVENMAEEPMTHFEIGAKEYARHELLGIKGIWHTHLYHDGFSPLDQEVMAADDIPWAVYCISKDSFSQCDPTAPAPFENRPFAFGRYDCYSLVSDVLAQMGVQLPSWERPRYGMWNTPDFTPFDEQAANVGRPVNNGRYQRGDILLLNLGDHPGHTDHVGVFVSPTHFLHHPAEQKSRINRFGSWWERRLRMVVRPEGLWSS